MPSFPLTLSVALGRLVASRSLCPSSCTATLDGSSFPCRYHGNNCMVSVSPSAARSSAEDINVAVINPYVGGLGDLMTMVEPSIAQALQDIEESNFLPGYRLNGYVVDSKCSVPDATSAAIAAMTTGPAKHVVFGDSCSAACEAVNDALRHFNVMQVGPGCVSVSLSDSTRFPYFTRMAPSFRFNVQTVYEIFKFLGFRRVGVVYGYRSINVLAKDLFLELMSGDNSAGSYSWTPLYTHRVELLQDAQSAVEEARRTDARINFMALYEAEGSMVLCQCHKKNMLTPDYNWFVASGWWNQNFILLTADTEKSPCSVSELQRAAYSLIAIDRGPMLDTSELHSLSGRPLSELYAEYTGACQGFANGKGVCNHQLAGYFYDGVWLIASILHTYLVEQNRSIADLGTEESRQALYDLSLSTDFYGQTGRVRQFNSVEPKTSPPSHGDRDGTLLLRQATGPVDQVFVELAFRTEAGFDFKTEIRWSPDGSKMVSCLGASCDLAGGWLPPDRSSSCPGGEVWTNTEGCTQCSPGDFATAAMLACAACGAGGFSNFSGADACQPCAPGFFAANTGATACAACGQGEYLETSSGTACLKCPAGTFSEAAGLTQCAECPPGRSSDFEGTSSARMCSCRPETRLEEEECVPCADTEVCEGGRVVATRPSAKQWLELVEQMSLLEAQGETMARLFLQIAAGIQVNSSKASLLDLMDVYNSSLFSITFGDSANNIPAPTSPEVQDALEDGRSDPACQVVKLSFGGVDPTPMAPRLIFWLVNRCNSP
ncbi:unnamed protein product [Effrenium voratum]|nr:unnamed protein product [Effrenium voratum]